MIDNTTSTKNTRQINGPSVQIIRDTDDILNIDTTLGAVTLSLQTILSSGALQSNRKVYINDIGNQCAVNPITILPSGGDTVNSGVSVIINVNGANAIGYAANQTEWAVIGVGVVSAGIGGGGTANRIAKFTTPSTIGDSLLFDNGVSVGLGTATPHASAILDISSTTQGLLYPRMTTVQRNAIATPATSLIIFNTTSNRFEYYNGAAWTVMDMNGIYGGAGTVPTSTVATVTDYLRFVAVDSGFTTEYGIGTDPLGFGNSGTVNYLFSTPPVNLEGWGGLMTVAGEPAWWQEVYNPAGDTSGFFAGYSVAQSNSYSSVYHFQVATGLYTGFEANASGEQLYSQRLALVPTALTVNDRVLFASASGGYIKATTYADLVTQLAIPTFYSSNGSTPGARTVTLGGTLQFNHGAAGVNGLFQLATGGYVLNQTANALNYFEYNHNTNIFSFFTDTAGVTGVRSTNTAGVNPDSLVELFAGSNQRAYLNIGPTTDFFDFYVNNTGKYAGGILGGSGAFNGSWGFGISPTAAAKVHIFSENGQGNGTIIQTGNLSPAESILQVRMASGVNVIDVRATGISFVSDRLVVGYNLGSLGAFGALTTKGSDSSFFTDGVNINDGSNVLLWNIKNNGNLGHGTAPIAGVKHYIYQSFNASYSAVLRIEHQAIGAGGSAIYVTGTDGDQYNAIWASNQAGASATGTNRGFYSTNYANAANGATSISGGEFFARNGNTYTIGVKGGAAGGDSTNPSDGTIGVWGEDQSQASGLRRAGYFTMSNATNFNTAVSYGNKIEVGYASAVANESVWGQHITMSVSGAGVAQYAITTLGGNIGFGTHTPSNQALVELVSTSQAFLIMRMTSTEASAITPANGMMLYVTDTNLTFIVVGFWGYEAGVWTKL